jgi:hypothetical protein
MGCWLPLLVVTRVLRKRKEQQSSKRGDNWKKWKRGHQLPMLVTTRVAERGERRREEQHSLERGATWERFECELNERIKK